MTHVYHKAASAFELSFSTFIYDARWMCFNLTPLHTSSWAKLEALAYITVQRLIQKEKVDINCEKCAQITILPIRLQHNDGPILSLRKPNKLYITFIFYFLVIIFKLCCWFDREKLELCLMVVSVLIKIKFGHT